ncbi:hypothetical protein DIPPA_04633 [Diplonema papillatum]|nr:hypothetical protein DIPPA_04633 [Diplonema papillatum]
MSTPRGAAAGGPNFARGILYGGGGGGGADFASPGRGGGGYTWPPPAGGEPTTRPVVAWQGLPLSPAKPPNPAARGGDFTGGGLGQQGAGPTDFSSHGGAAPTRADSALANALGSGGIGGGYSMTHGLGTGFVPGSGLMGLRGPAGVADTGMMSPRRDSPHRQGPHLRSSSASGGADPQAHRSATFRTATPPLPNVVSFPGAHHQLSFVHHYNLPRRDGLKEPQPLPPGSRPPTPGLSARDAVSRDVFEAVKKKLEHAEAELFDEQRKRAAAEARNLELQSSSCVRVLEGKISGLQVLLEQKTGEYEKCSSQKLAAQQQSDELAHAVGRSNAAVQELEVESGHQAVVIAELEKELDKAKRVIADLERGLDEQFEKERLAKLEHSAAAAAREREDSELKGVIRSKSRQIQDLEMERLSFSEEISLLQKDMTTMHGELRDALVAKDELEARVVAAQQAEECFENKDAQRQIIAEGLKRELEREIDKSQTLLTDLRAAERQRIELEERLRLVQQQLQKLPAIEERNLFLEETVQKLETELDVETQAHRDSRQHIKELEHNLSQVGELKQLLAQAEAEANAKTEALARMHQTLESHTQEVAFLQGELDRAAARAAAVQADMDTVEHRNSKLTGEVDQLGREVSHMQALREEVRAQRDKVDAKSDEIRQLNAELARARMADRELQHRVQEIAELDEKLAATMRQRSDVLDELSRLQVAAGRLEEDNSHLAQQLENTKQLLHSESSQVSSLESTCRSLQQQVSVQPHLEAQIQTLHNDVNNCSSEIESLTCLLDQRMATIKHLEEQLDFQQQQQQALEAANTQQVVTIESLQVESGRHLIVMQERDKSIARLAAEHEDAMKELNDANTRLQQMAADGAAAAQESTDLQSKVDALTSELRQIAEQREQLKLECSELAAALAAEQERCRKLDGRVIAVETEAVRCNTLEGKIEALQGVNSARSRENEDLVAAVNQLRQQLRCTEQDVANAASLEVRVKDLRVQLAQQVEDMERIEQDDSKKAIALAEARKELEREVERVKSTTRYLEDERAKAQMLTDRVHQLEAAAAQRSSLEGKIAGLEILAESKESELQGLLHENNALRQKTKKLEAELGSQARVEDVVHEAQTQLLIKNDAIARLEKDETKRRQLLDDQHREIIGLGDKVRALEAELGKEGAKRMDSEARLQEISKELTVKSRADEAESRDRAMQAERMTAEMRDVKDKVYGYERSLRIASQKLADAEDVVAQHRAALQRADEEKHQLVRETQEWRNEVQKEKTRCGGVSNRMAELEGELRLQKEKEERLAKTLTAELQDTAAKLDAKLRDERCRSAALERETLKLREELQYLSGALSRSAPGQAYLAPPQQQQQHEAASYDASQLRSKAEHLANEWERTKENVTLLREQLMHG